MKWQKGSSLPCLDYGRETNRQLIIPPDLAFGFPDETLLRSLHRDEFDDSLEMEQGLIIEFTTDDGNTLPGTILEYDDNEVRIDLNHPLAGQTVRYYVKILDVLNETESETIN